MADPTTGDPFALESARAIHVVGAGGSGMSAIATVLAAMGMTVTGSDLKESAALRRLEGLGVTIQVGHRAENVGDVDAVAISTAVPASNPEVAEARRRGIAVIRRAEVLAAICRLRPTIAVAGTHGKTTTSSMLAMILVEAGMHPSFLIGGDLNDVGGGAVWDADHDEAPFVVEADESDGTFLELGAHGVIVTNVEPDHLDYWGDFGRLTDAFERFVRGASGPKVVGVDDPGGARLAAATGALTFGAAAGADWHLRRTASGRRGTHMVVAHRGEDVAEIELAVPGQHNARNALAAFAMAVELGAPAEAGVRALERYAGVARRWQFRGEAHGVTFVDDYAHLPSETAVAVATAADGDWRRVVVVFQPHRFSRTAALWADFGDAFPGADLLVVTDVYPAGEEPRPGVTGKLIVNAVLDRHPEAQVAWLPLRRDVVGYVTRTLRPGDLCLTLGAGDLTSLPDEVIPLLTDPGP